MRSAGSDDRPPQTLARTLRYDRRMLALLLLLSHAAISDAPNPPGGALATDDRVRVLVSTDAGGSDPDDLQSLVHLFVYADEFDLEGLVSSPPKQGRAADILRVVDAYERDYPTLATHSDRYPTPERLREITVQGAEDPAPDAGWSQPTDGSRLLIERAMADDPRPLYVLVWGSLTDVAQALHDAPEIKRRIRVFFIASWNWKMDRAAVAYVEREHADLWMVFSDRTFRGWYKGGDQSEGYGNGSFVAEHVAGHGALGDYFASLRPDDGGGERFGVGEIKMGDTPSLAWLLRGDADDPSQPSWGGQYVRVDGRPHWWTDRKDDPEQTVSRWRRAYLDDFAVRMDRCVTE